MPEFNPAHRTPPPEITPEEAERNKRIEGQNKADQAPPGDGADGDTKPSPNPGKATA